MVVVMYSIETLMFTRNENCAMYMYMYMYTDIHKIQRLKVVLRTTPFHHSTGMHLFLLGIPVYLLYR